MTNCDTQVTVFGNVTRDAEMRKAGNTNVLSFTVAASTGRKNADGQYGSDFFNVSVWGKDAEYWNNIQLKKGTPVVVEGDLYSETYTAKDGTNRYCMNVTANKIKPYGKFSYPRKEAIPAAATPANDEAPF